MNSIRQLVTFRLIVACTLLWTAGCITIYVSVRYGMIKEFDQVLRANAQALDAMTEQDHGQLEFNFDGELLPGFSRNRRPNYFQLWRPDGSTLGRSASLKDADLPRPAGMLTSHHSWNLILPDGLPGRAIGLKFAPIVDETSAVAGVSTLAPGEVTLVVARHRADLDSHLILLQSTLLLVGLILTGVTLLVVTFAVRDGLQPLSQLQNHASTIDALSLHIRFPTVDMPAELLPIAGRLNDLLARLEASFVRERQFSANVAHELRTPIAELRSLAEVALQWPEDVKSERHAWQDALEIALQMESLATELLALARCEGRFLSVQFEPVRLAPLLENIWRPFAEKARTKNLITTLTVPDDVTWYTDSSLLSAILTNLLDNAVEYTPPGGKLALRLESNVNLLISNTTNELKPDDLPHLFHRFWRKDPARSVAGHSGLGLAVAKAYAETIGLCLVAELSTPDTFTVSLSKATNS